MRGFPVPAVLSEQLRDNYDRMFVVRLTDWEASFLRPGEGLDGRFVLMPSNDGSYDLVRVRAGA